MMLLSEVGERMASVGFFRYLSRIPAHKKEIIFVWALYAHITLSLKCTVPKKTKELSIVRKGNINGSTDCGILANEVDKILRL